MCPTVNFRLIGLFVSCLLLYALLNLFACFKSCSRKIEDVLSSLPNVCSFSQAGKSLLCHTDDLWSIGSSWEKDWDDAVDWSGVCWIGAFHRVLMRFLMSTVSSINGGLIYRWKVLVKHPRQEQKRSNLIDRKEGSQQNQLESGGLCTPSRHVEPTYFVIITVMLFVV